jgi:hypothetical protein
MCQKKKKILHCLLCLPINGYLLILRGYNIKNTIGFCFTFTSAVPRFFFLRHGFHFQWPAGGGCYAAEPCYYARSSQGTPALYIITTAPAPGTPFRFALCFTPDSSLFSLLLYAPFPSRRFFFGLVRVVTEAGCFLCCRAI